MKLKVEPRGEQVLVKRIVDEKSDGGIILIHKQQPSIVASKGEVLAVGPGVLMENFKRKPIEGVAVGDKVYFHTYPNGVEVTLDDKSVGVLIAEKQIVGVIRG